MNRRGFFGRVIGAVAATRLAPLLGKNAAAVIHVQGVSLVSSVDYPIVGIALERAEKGAYATVDLTGMWDDGSCEMPPTSVVEVEAGETIQAGDLLISSGDGRVVPYRAPSGTDHPDCPHP